MTHSYLKNRGECTNCKFMEDSVLKKEQSQY